MAERSEVAKKLKRLRELAGLSIGDVARALGKPRSTYASKEDKFKQKYLPMDFIKALVPIFEPKGVSPADLLALAGVRELSPGSTGGVNDQLTKPTENRHHQDEQGGNGQMLHFETIKQLGQLEERVKQLEAQIEKIRGGAPKRRPQGGRRRTRATS